MDRILQRVNLQDQFFFETNRQPDELVEDFYDEMTPEVIP